MKKNWNFLRYSLGTFFAVAGLAKILGFSAQAGWLTSFGMPLASVAIGVALVIELAGGILLLANRQVKNASMVLGIFMALVILIVNLSLLSAPFANAGIMPSESGLSIWNLFSNLVVLAALWGLYKS